MKRFETFFQNIDPTKGDGIGRSLCRIKDKRINCVLLTYYV